MNCPEHGDTMRKVKTRYGGRWGCTVTGCSVVCWDGKTSTPADAETHALRHRCHELFDRLRQPGPYRAYQMRWQAYTELRRVMGTSHAKTHIGMFTKEQCLRLIAHLLDEPAPVEEHA